MTFTESPALLCSVNLNNRAIADYQVSQAGHKHPTIIIGKAAVIKAPDLVGASITSTARLRPAIIRFRGKVSDPVVSQLDTTQTNP